MSELVAIPYGETGLATFYIIAKRLSDGYYIASLNGTTPVYQQAMPDPRPSLVEDGEMKKTYLWGPVTITERHIYVVYKQIGGAQSPIDDDIIASGYLDKEGAKAEELAVVAGYLDTEVQQIVTILTSSVYGLSKLKTLIDDIDTSTELAARFTEIKGVGWTTETLKALNLLALRLTMADLLGYKTSSVIQLMTTVQNGETQKVRRGANKGFKFIFSADFTLTGTEQIYFTAKKDPVLADATAIFDKLCVITDAPNRTCTVSLTSLEMTVSPGRYKAEVTIYDADGVSNVRKPISIDLEVEQDVRHGS